jgi:hypothetical protein
MSQRRANGRGVLIDPQPGPDEAFRRVQGALELQQAQLETLAEKVQAMTEAERLEWCAGGILSLLQTVEGLKAICTPIAMEMDELRRWKAGTERWMAQVNAWMHRDRGQ